MLQVGIQLGMLGCSLWTHFNAIDKHKLYVFPIRVMVLLAVAIWIFCMLLPKSVVASSAALLITLAYLHWACPPACDAQTPPTTSIKLNRKLWTNLVLAIQENNNHPPENHAHESCISDPVASLFVFSM